jgi:hypothetical protein
MAEGGAFVAGAITAKMLLDLTGWSKGLKQVTDDTKKIGGDAAEMGRKISGVGKAMTAIGGAVTGTLVAMVKATANAGDQINDLAKRTGISTEELSRYKYAADQSGTSLEGIVTGVRRLSAGMLDSSRGLAAAKISFDELGISVTNADGSLRPINDVMMDAADRFSKMEDGAKKAALAQDLFGRSGMDLIPLLNEGRDGMAKLFAEADRLGVVFSSETAAASDAFNDSLSKLKSSLAGVTQQFAVQIMPMLTNLVDGIGNVVSKLTDWIKAHPELAKAIGTFGIALGGILTGTGLLVTVVGKLITGFTLLAARIGMTGAALATSLGAWAAIATAAYKVYEITNNLIKAKERLIDADYALFETQQRLGQKLREAADAAGITRREFVALTEKYHGNTAALAMAIKRGEEGVALQESLAKVGAEHAAAIDKQREAQDKANKSLDGLAGAATLAMPPMTALTQQAIDAGAAFQKMADQNIADVIDQLNFETGIGTIVEIPIEMDLGGLEEQAGTGIEILDQFNADAAELVAAASEQARTQLEEYQRISDQVFADIISGFGEIITADKSMGQIFSDITKKMIADMGKLVIQEMLFSKKSIIAKQMESVAAFISSIFKKIPFPLNIILAAGAFALVSKLFSKLTKFAEGGAFEKPTVIQNAIVGEAGPEYLLPEAKLVRIVQNAMKFNPFTAVPTLAPMAATAGGPSIAVNINSPLITTVGLTRRDLESAGEDLMAVIETQLRRSGKGM